MGQNRNSPFWIAMQKPQGELVDQRRFSSAARSSETDDFRCSMFLPVLRWALSVGCSTFSAPNPIGLFDLAEVVREFLIKRSWSRPSGSRLAITLMHKFHHVVELCAGKENFAHTFASHPCRVVMRDGAAAAPENLDFVCAFLAQKIDTGRENFDMPAVVTRNANRAHVLLDGGPDDVANRAVVTEIDHFDPVPDKLQIDRVDRAIVTITNRNCG